MPEESPFQVVALTRVLNVEGTFGRGQEPFRGLALAIGWWPESDGRARGRPARTPAWQHGALPEMHYLVSDMERPAPIWVSASDVTRQYHGGGAA